MLIQSVKKEAILIFNDLHSVAVLFLLPITFMIIMTLALSEKQHNLVRKISLSVEAQNNSIHSQAFAHYLSGQGFQLVTSTDNNVDVTIRLGQSFDKALLLRDGDGKIKVNLGADLSPQVRNMVTELIKVSLSKLKLHAYMESVGDFDGIDKLVEKVSLVEQSADVGYLVTFEQQDEQLVAPTLFSIPAWIVFGVYFIVLPISITLINERQNGTLIRIKTYPISTSEYFANKAISYSILSFIQWLGLSLIGLIAIPLLVEQPVLSVNHLILYFSAGALVVMSAIGFAFLLASLVTTFEQAIVLGGGINILLAALSGFMVPIDVMPEMMASIAKFSPMYWASESLRQGIMGAPWSLAVTNLLKLGLFAILCFSLALVIFNNKSRKLLWN